MATAMAATPYLGKKMGTMMTIVNDDGDGGEAVNSNHVEARNA